MTTPKYARRAALAGVLLLAACLAAGLAEWSCRPAPVPPMPGPGALRSQTVTGAMAVPHVLTEKDVTLSSLPGRPLLLFAPSEEHPMLAEQRDLLPPAETLAGRDVRLVEVPEEGFGRAGHALLDLTAGRALRRKHSVSAGEFALVLLDRDGVERFRSGSPVAWPRITEVIDARAARAAESTRRGA